MKVTDYRAVYNSLALTSDQKRSVCTLLDENLKGCGERHGVSIYYLDAINSLFRFFSGDMECHDEFDDEHNLIIGAWDVKAINRVVDAFESQNAFHAAIFQKRAKLIRNGLKAALNSDQYKLLDKVFALHFRRHAWYIDNYIEEEGEAAVLPEGAYVAAKLSFMRAMSISVEDLKESCFLN